MMKYFCFGLAFSLTGFLVACGSGSNTAPVTYGASSYSPYSINGSQTGCVDATCSTIAIAGGTETQTPLFRSQMSSVDASTKVFAETANVVAGDRVVVLMGGAVVQGSVGTSTVSSVDVRVNGSSISGGSSSPQNEYVVSTAGTLTAKVNWLLSGSSGTKAVNVGQGIWVLHCLSTSGAAMVCPYW